MLAKRGHIRIAAAAVVFVAAPDTYLLAAVGPAVDSSAPSDFVAAFDNWTALAAYMPIVVPFVVADEIAVVFVVVVIAGFDTRFPCCSAIVGILQFECKWEVGLAVVPVAFAFPHLRHCPLAVVQQLVDFGPQPESVAFDLSIH